MDVRREIRISSVVSATSSDYVGHMVTSQRLMIIVVNDITGDPRPILLILGDIL